MYLLLTGSLALMWLPVQLLGAIE